MVFEQQSDVRERQIRVVLVECKGLLGDLIRNTLDRQVDITVVAEAQAMELPGMLAKAQPDVVIWNSDDGDGFLGGWVEAFTSHVPAKVFATLEHGRAGALWELRPTRTKLGELSTDLLLETIRSVTR